MNPKPRPCRKFFPAWFLLLSWLSLAQAQEQTVTLVLHSGEELACRINKISKEFIYFEAASTKLAYKYGEKIEVEKIAMVRLSNGRTLSVNEFLMQQEGASPKAEPIAPTPAPPSGPGLRVASSLLDTTEVKTKIGLRLPEMPPSGAIHFIEIADLLAEAGLAGKLLYEIDAGLPHGRELTKSQNELVDAIPKSAVWLARQHDLQEANRLAEDEFNVLRHNQPDLLAEEFRFRPSSNKHAFLEFVQFLHLDNVLHFNDKWQKVETAFGHEVAAALRDILNNFEDWYYLFGQEIENQ